MRALMSAVLAVGCAGAPSTHPLPPEDTGTAPPSRVLSLADAGTALHGEASDSSAGNSVAGVGDVDGDGLADLLIGSMGDDEAGPGAGAAYLVLGPATGLDSLADADAKLLGALSGETAGYSVAGAGDLDGDGLADLLISAFSDNTGGLYAGAAYVVYGPVSGTTSLAGADAKLHGEATWDSAGSDATGVGDVNGDGLDDLLIGAPHKDEAGTYAGAAYVVYGPVSGTASLASADVKLLGEAPDTFTGYSVASAGDVDGDGLADLLIGAYGDASGEGAQAAHGAAYLVLGPATGASLADADAKLLGAYALDNVGHSVAGAGDVDGDGLDDLLLGSGGDDERANAAGAAYVVYGPVSGTSSLADADAKLLGESATAYAGTQVASAGDADGDGLDDLLIGAHGDDEGGVEAGAAYLVYGSVAGTTSLADADIKLLGAPDDGAGFRLASAGDVDGDGLDDLLFGVPQHSGAGANAGVAYLISGGL